MIRRRWLLVAAPLCVVTVAASVAFAATPDTEHSKDAKLDKLHVERPIAASDPSDLVTTVVANRRRAMVLRELGRAAEDAFAVLVDLKLASDQAAVDAFLATLAPPVRSAPQRFAADSAADSASAGGDALACIRARESDTSGGYQAVSSSGTYRGAYQFMQSTWDSTASSAGRSDLVGVDPATVAPADQDALASHLYAQAGSQPWGGSC